MTGSNGAGISRLMNSGALAALVALAGYAGAQGSATTGSVQSQVMIRVQDSARVSRMYIITPLVDSLVKRLNVLPMGSAEFVATQVALDAAIRELPAPAAGGTFRVIAAPQMRSLTDLVPLGTLGFTTDGVNRVTYSPAGNYLQYFEYPTVVAIETNSPAARAGVRTGDLLIAYDGIDVRANPINMTRLLTPGREVTVKLRHDSDTRDVLMSVEKASAALIADRRADAASAMGPTPLGFEQRRAVEEQVVAARARPTAPRGGNAATATTTPRAQGTEAIAVYREFPTAAATMAPSVNGVLGAAMTELDPGLATAVKGAEGKQGVLVTKVPAGSVADRTGLRSGDVILRVESHDVSTVAQFRVRIAMAEQNGQGKVKLTILRGGKTQDISYFTR